MKYKETAKKILKFFRLTDDNNVVSLTNLTMMIVMYKLLITSPGWAEMTTLAIAVMGYQGKRMIGK